MNAIAKVEPRKSVIATLADNYGMEAAAFEATLRGTVFPSNGTREEFAAFVLVAKEYRLNPLLREIYAFPKKGGGIVPIVGIDGWLNLINGHPQFDGMEFDQHDDEKGALVAVTCRIYRKDRSHPTVVTEYLDECIRGTEPWKMKRRMLRHKAAMQGARYAFGFSGIYDEDEAADIAQVRDVGGRSLPAEPPPPPSDDDIRPASAAIAVEDAVIVAESAPASPSQQVADAAGASASIPQHEDAPAAPSEDAIDPEAILGNLAEQLSVCQDEACIEEGYGYLDVEAELSGFEGYVEKARALKAEHLGRVAKIAAAAETDAPEAPALSDDEAPLPPPSDEEKQFDLNGWQDIAHERAYAGYAELLVDYAKTKGDFTIIETFWKDSQPVRAKLIPLNERNKLKDALLALWEKA